MSLPKITINIKPKSDDGKTKEGLTIEERYQHLELAEHILLKPEVYIGSPQRVEQDMFIYDDTTSKMIKSRIKFVPGLYKLYDEGIVNMRDHYVRMSELIAKQSMINEGKLPSDPRIDVNRKYHPVKKIEITVDPVNNTIVLRNDGDGIDIVQHKTEHIYIPELIFGVLLTGTNFDKKEEKIIGGQNGYGAKLINLMSTEFIIETVDSVRCLKYTQRFTDNMKKHEDPEIVSYNKVPYTQITFKPDLSRFGMTKLDDDDTIKLMYKRAYDLSACTSKDVSVYYNGKKIEVKTFERYVDLYIGGRSQQKRIYAKINQDWEIAVSVSPDNTFEHVSFVNGICTYRGGKHVDHASTVISNRLAKYATENKKGMKNITAKHIKDNMWIFINTTMVNPTFDTQTKEYFVNNITSFRNKCDVDDDFIQKLSSPQMEILERSLSLSNFKSENDLKKTDGKKVRHVKNEKLDDAPYAGTSKSLECCLIVTEGDSATGSAKSGLAAFNEEKRKYYGVLPLRGKIINPKGKSLSRLERKGKGVNEFISLKETLGLQQNHDYSESKDGLRYGKIIFMTDADVDGAHIKGLGFNLFHEFWPSLLKRDDFVYSILTPIVKLINKHNEKEVLSFYALGQVQDWEKTNDKSQWEYQYYKGLATHTPAESKEIFSNMKLQSYSWNNLERTEHRNELLKIPTDVSNVPIDVPDDISVDGQIPTTTDCEIDDQSTEDGDELDVDKSVSFEKSVQLFRQYCRETKCHPCELAIQLAFGKKNADKRKGWIVEYLKQKAQKNIDLNLDRLELLNYHDFVMEKLVEYAVDNVERSIPSMVDGMKPVQRKILYTALNDTFKNPRTKNVKVFEFCGGVSKFAKYHHGDISLDETIVGMAQDFPGSNNINLLVPAGIFGSRYGNTEHIGADSGAPRYIHTNLSPITRVLFNNNDNPIYTYALDDGVIAEPTYYVPELPLVLINGVRGIGTGWSTFVPCYNPSDIIRNIHHYMVGEPLEEMIPWYRGFKGTITKIKHQQYGVHGTYNRTGPTTVEITEIPLGGSHSKSFRQYTNFINSMIIDNSHDRDKDSNPKKGKKKETVQVLKDAETLTTDKTINSKLIFPSSAQLDDLLATPEKFEKMFGLCDVIRTSNMYLFNEQCIITKYETPEDILKAFMQVRYNFHEKRRNYLVNQSSEEISKINEKIRFISYINDDTHELKLKGKSKLEVTSLLEKYKFIKMRSNSNKNRKTVDDENTEGEGEEDVSLNQGDYKYLLNMPISSVTPEKIEQLKHEKDNIIQKIDDLKKLTNQQMWSDELSNVQKQLDIFDSKWNEDYIDLSKSTGSDIGIKPKRTYKKRNTKIDVKPAVITIKPKIKITIK